MPDSSLSIQDVKAASVIAQDKSTGINSISARSNEINVQAIMEAMHGGGHMTAAQHSVRMRQSKN